MRNEDPSVGVRKMGLVPNSQRTVSWSKGSLKLRSTSVGQPLGQDHLRGNLSWGPIGIDDRLVDSHDGLRASRWCADLD